VLEVISCRGREVEVLRQILQDANVHPEVRLFLEEILGRHPDQYIRSLAAARNREDSENGREELTRVCGSCFKLRPPHYCEGSPQAAQ